MNEPLTDDRLLGGRVHLRQPARGYRAAVDPILLAAAVPAQPGERILDAGAGTGAASLCLAARVPDCAIVGLELQRELQQIATGNVAANQADDRIQVFHGDLAQPPPRLPGASFDHVMTNPPHLAATATSPSPRLDRALAHTEGTLDLAGWLQACLRMLKSDGCLTLIHRAERTADVLAALVDRVGDLVLFPLWPGAARPAKRILVQGRKGRRGPLRLAPGLVLHDREGGFTGAAEAILRHGRPLDLDDHAGARRHA